MPTDNEIINRIKYLMQEMGCRQAQFAAKIDVDASNFTKYLNGRLPVSDALINKIVVNMGVSKEWLEQGTDIPFAKQQLPAAVTLNPSLVAATTQAGAGTPVYDIDVTAGSMPRARMFADDRIIGSVNLPQVLSPGNRIVRVSGDSMDPVIRDGDYIAVRELSSMNTIFWGQIYVVLLDDYRLLKYVRRHDDPAMVILRSENPRYDDMDVRRTDIRELMFVQNILHVDTRM